jgi:hypothetical protein
MTHARFALVALLLLAPGVCGAQQRTSNAQQPMPAKAKSAGKTSAEDLRLRTIYNAEDAWRKAQRGAQDPDNPHRIPAQLPFVNAAKQQADLEHWHAVILKIDALHPALLSPRQLPGLPRPARHADSRAKVPRVRAPRQLRLDLLVRRRRHRPRNSPHSSGLRKLHLAAPRPPALLPRKHH